ncbi:MAG TPA: MFS transporter [Anaerolineaceae bacterium]|nr:MFS transporter [Anaerolineaceae bacterium]
MSTRSNTLLIDRRFSPIVLSHFIIDLMNVQTPILLTFLSGSLGLTNGLLGLFNSIFQLTGSLSQPIFGYLTDRIGVRRMVVSSVLWMGSFFTLALVVPGWPALIFLIISALGSGAFHPAGASQATTVGRNLMAGRETTSASIFFTFGQLGYFIGPLIGGILLTTWSKSGLLILSVLALITSGIDVWQFQVDVLPVSVIKGSAAKLSNNFKQIGWLGLTALIVVAAFQSWIFQTVLAFLPKYLSDLGEPASIYGLIAAFFMGGTTFGNLLGGNLADRVGKRWVVIFGMGLSTLPLFLIPQTAASSLLMYPLVFLAGLFNGTVNSISIVLAQKLIPGGLGLASGLAMGFIFSAGGIGILASGALADRLGLISVFYLCTILAVTGAIMGIFLVDREYQQ